MGPIIEQVDPGDMEREREGRERGGGGQEQGGRERGEREGEGDRNREGERGERERGRGTGTGRERESERGGGGMGRDGKRYTPDSLSYCIQVNVETETHLFPSWTHPAMSLMGMCSRFTLVLV